MRLNNSILGVACLAALLGTAAHGASVSGAVKGADGAPFKGAFVQAQNLKTKIMVSVLSDKDGHYRIENLPAGEYRLQVRAVGFKVDPRTGVNLTADQNASYEFALQKGTVRWNEISIYQGSKLLPEGRGKDILFGRCFACHGFQTRMASIVRDEEGWRDRVNYMREAMHYFLDGTGGRFSEQNASDVTSYINRVFGEDSALPKSPADLPEYKNLVKSFSDEAMKIVYVEYELPGPNRMPWSAAPDKDGNLWMPYYGKANMIGRLNPKTGEVQEFPVPNVGTAGVHSAVMASDGNVWLSEQGANKLGKWDPRTGKIIEYQDAYIPGREGILSGGSKHTVGIDSKGYIWASGGPLTRFDPETQKFTRFEEVPTCYQVFVDRQDNAWFTEMVSGGKIGKVDAKTGKVTKYTLPDTDYRPHRLTIDSQGIVWFDGHTDKLMRFDPKTETFKEFPLPGPAATPYAITGDQNGGVWYSSTDMDLIGRLDPKTGHVIEYPFPHSEIAMREFFLDSQGRMWWASPPNNRVGYLYLAGQGERASN